MHFESNACGSTLHYFTLRGPKLKVYAERFEEKSDRLFYDFAAGARFCAVSGIDPVKPTHCVNPGVQQALWGMAHMGGCAKQQCVKKSKRYQMSHKHATGGDGGKRIIVTMQSSKLNKCP